MGRPDSEAPTSSITEGLAALLDHSHGSRGGGAAAPARQDSSFDTNVVTILAVLFFALLFAIGLNSLARCALRRYVGLGAAVAAGQAGATARVASSGSGIKRRVLRSLPVEVYGSGEDIDDVCAICLGEFMDGEKVRVLPQCGHGFHVRCVDAWLVFHSSCPTCRRPVIDSTPAKADDGGIGHLQCPAEADSIVVVIV